jgi:hypothetical protein
MSELRRAFAYMWEFTVKAEHKMTFEELYNPGGKWTELFKKANGYIRSELLHDSLDSSKYITIDYWNSSVDRGKFTLEFSDAYKALDSQCGAFTLKERYIGEFDVTF